MSTKLECVLSSIIGTQPLLPFAWTWTLERTQCNCIFSLVSAFLCLALVTFLLKSVFWISSGDDIFFHVRWVVRFLCLCSSLLYCQRMCCSDLQRYFYTSIFLTIFRNNSKITCCVILLWQQLSSNNTVRVHLLLLVWRSFHKNTLHHLDLTT